MADSIFEALQEFAEEVKKKMSQQISGEPEEQLRSPFETLVKKIYKQQGFEVVPVGETSVKGVGKPDFSIHKNKMLVGYVELKAPGTGVNDKNFKGRNLEQWNRFKVIPNIIYIDGNEWVIYYSGEKATDIVKFKYDIVEKGKDAVDLESANKIEDLFRTFLAWKAINIIPIRKGKINLKGFAKILAPLCKMLRNEVTDSINDKNSRLNELAENWRTLLFPGASDDKFADAYAQTITFALLLSRGLLEGQLTFNNVQSVLIEKYSLMSKAFQILTDETIRKELQTSLDILFRVIDDVPMKALLGTDDPWLNFYEDFLAEYDPKLKQDAGVYFTPAAVVHAQVRLIDELLVKELKIGDGFSDPQVLTLDPAIGTGTYLLGIIEHAMNKLEHKEGIGALPAAATGLAEQLFGFEILVGPYSVSEFRVSYALNKYKARIPTTGLNIYLTDTLESPYTEYQQLGLFYEIIAKQHQQAIRVKNETPILVCLGNPPYDRHKSKDKGLESETGSWVRWGDSKKKEEEPILNDYILPAKKAGYGVHLKNLYNFYIYFWRWALWKVFEHKNENTPGIVSFITASSYLHGKAFSFMREHIRRICDEIWIIDLGGNLRGARKEENIFPTIQTPVAIAITLRKRLKDKKLPAKTHYTRISGNREAKFSKLEAIQTFDSLEWKDCPDDWQSKFLPTGEGAYFDFPLLTDLMPWQQSGVKYGRTWPICPDKDTLKRRWSQLLGAKERAKAFKESRDRKIKKHNNSSLEFLNYEGSIATLPENEKIPKVVRYGYRSFDNQWVIADNRLADSISPSLWAVFSDKQIYFASMFEIPLGDGPCLTCSVYPPDLDFFLGSHGSKQIIPIYRDPKGVKPNIIDGLLDKISEDLKIKVDYDKFISYIYGILSNNVFMKNYYRELETCELRIPITKDSSLFDQVSGLGYKLIHLHTYGLRFNLNNQEIEGSTKCIKSIDSIPVEYYYNDKTKTLHIGSGEFSPVSKEMFDFEVSGLKIVQSWLDYRLKDGSGNKSSPLDNIRPENWTREYTSELLNLLWVIESTLNIYKTSDAIFKKVVSNPCFMENELPEVDDKLREAPSFENPKTRKANELFT